MCGCAVSGYTHSPTSYSAPLPLPYPSLPLPLPSPPPCRLPLDVSSAVALPLEQLLGQSTHSEWIFAYLMCVQS